MTLVILWVSWCKNKSFWQRFTCNNCNAVCKNISRIYGCINNPVLSELFISNLFDLCIGHLISIERDWKCRFEIIWTSKYKSFQSSLVSIIGASSYSEAIRETTLCGGDSCTRGILIGACLGASELMESKISLKNQ